MVYSTLLIAVCVALVVNVVYWGCSCVLFFENRRFSKIRKSLPRPCPESFPRAMLIIPCKGMEHRLRENLTKFLQQDHPNYQICFVVESMDDSAVPIIQNLQYENRFIESRIVIAGRAVESGQKVHNLLAATEEVPHDVDVLVFADSDAGPGKSWLRFLTYNIGTKGLGANTGYRWMIPKQNNLWSKIGCSINNLLAAMMGRGKHLLVWGGSWAIHRKVFLASGVREAWHGTLSDDLVASRALHAAGLEVRFEPNAVCESHVYFSFHGLFEFLRRQFIIGRIHAPWYWASALLLTLCNQIALWGSVGFAIYSWFTDSSMFMGASIVAATVYVGSVFLGSMRVQIGKVYCSTWSDQSSAKNFDRWCSPIYSLAGLSAMLVALAGNEICWRGIRYVIHRGGQIRLIGRSVASDLWPLNQQAGSEQLKEQSNSEDSEIGQREIENTQSEQNRRAA